MEILVVIPARGGSKGIPRKNLRKLNHQPLIFYAIKTALKSLFSPDVYVSSEDQEILTTAEKLGAKLHRRDDQLSGDSVTLDPVIYASVLHAESREAKLYDIVITLQPTSPLLEVSTLDGAIQRMIDERELGTLLSGIEDVHLRWRKEGIRFVPDFKERLNRQYLPQTFKETGSFLITRRENVSDKGRIGTCVELYEVSSKEGIDIDTFEDWSICEYYLQRKKILFNVIGYAQVGMGHIYNALIIAHEIVDHEIIFLVDSRSDLGYQKIKEHNFEVVQANDNILDEMKKINPDIIINDCLDTNVTLVDLQNNIAKSVITFEDLGSGSEMSDLVFNAMYQDNSSHKGHYYGYKYYCSREEFILTDIKEFEGTVKTVLLTFGGTDENNLTYKVLSAIYDYCISNSVEINVVTGLGYIDFDSLRQFEKVIVLRDIKNISDYMAVADLAITSAGRTTFELASLGVPAIVLGQNDRELTHFFANEAYGFLNLGLGLNVKKSIILDNFKKLVEDNEIRFSMRQKMLRCDLLKGKRRVIQIIKNHINSL